MWRVLVLILTALGTTGTAASAASQSGEAEAKLRIGLEAVAAGDTAAGLTSLNRAVRLEPSLAEAHLQIGLIHAARAGGEPPDYQERLKAQRALEEAISHAPHEPRYMLEYAKILLLQQVRVDARRALERTLELAGDDNVEIEAEAHFQLGLYQEREWRRLLSTMPFPGRHAAGISDVEPGFRNREAMLDHLFKALALQPDHAGAHSHILAYLFDSGERDQYLQIAQRFVERAPESVRAHLLLGLGLTWTQQRDKATQAFDTALALMDTQQKLRYLATGPAGATTWAEPGDGLTGADLLEHYQRLWNRANPLRLTPYNENWLAHASQMAYTEVRLGVVGHQPFGRLGREQVSWRTQLAGEPYPSPQPRFGAGIFTVLKNGLLPVQHPVPMQAARFRGGSNVMEVEIHAMLPLSDLVAPATVRDGIVEFGLFVLDDSARSLIHDVHHEELDFQTDTATRLETWRLDLPDDRTCLVNAEAREPLTWHAATGQIHVEPLSFRGDSLMLSDLLLVDSVAPIHDEQPQERSDFVMRPNPRMKYRPWQPIGMYYEIYNLAADQDNYVSYEVELTIRLDRIRRDPEDIIAFLIGDLADRWGFTPAGTTASRIRFQKQVRAQAMETVPEFFQVRLPGAIVGDYTLQVQVTDLVDRSTAKTQRIFIIRDER